MNILILWRKQYIDAWGWNKIQFIIQDTIQTHLLGSPYDLIMVCWKQWNRFAVLDPLFEPWTFCYNSSWTFFTENILLPLIWHLKTKLSPEPRLQNLWSQKAKHKGCVCVRTQIEGEEKQVWSCGTCRVNLLQCGLYWYYIDIVPCYISFRNILIYIQILRSHLLLTDAFAKKYECLTLPPMTASFYAILTFEQKINTIHSIE